ncbi:MAG: hypothetical protein IJ795_06700 [Bacteroidales bacterium]|nr:hypothetical protein [Bacteroidales bacterium]
MIRRIIAAAFAALALAACSESPEYTPLEEAVLSHIKARVGPEATFKVTKIVKADSLTTGQLYEQRIKAFKVKKDQDTKYYEKYKAKKMEANAEKHKKGMEKDALILKGLEEMRPAIEAKSSEIVCYDYTVSGSAEDKDVVTVFEDFWVAISPEGEVLSTNHTRRGLHKGFGKFLDGYIGLLATAGDLDDE